MSDLEFIYTALISEYVLLLSVISLALESILTALLLLFCITDDKADELLRRERYVGNWRTVVTQNRPATRSNVLC